MFRSISVVSLLGVFFHLVCSGLIKAEETSPAEKKRAVIIGASSMDGLPELLEALSAVGKSPMKVERGHYTPNDLNRLLALK
jgi:hypothetical protein